MASRSIISITPRQQAGSDDAGDSVACCFSKLEVGGEDGPSTFRAWAAAAAYISSRNAKQPFAADKQTRPMRVGLSLSWLSPPSWDDLAIGQDGLETEDVVSWSCHILEQCTPPELKAMLPPIVQINWLEGSGP